MAFTARTETYVNLASLTTPFDITVTKPTGTADGDILFCWIAARYNGTDPIDSVPSGWTLLGYSGRLRTYYHYWLYYKIASSEPTSWIWSFKASVKVRAVCSCYTSGDFDSSDPIDVVSNTSFIINNTACRAASMNVAYLNSPLIFWGGCYSTASKTFTKPSIPTTGWVEDDDAGSTTPDFWTEVCSMIWSGSGNTGFMDATISASLGTKHAFAVTLKPIYKITAQIQAGRDAVTTYRSDHQALYSGGWYQGISEDHTPLFNTLLAALSAQGFSSLDEFSTASDACGDGWQ